MPPLRQRGQASSLNLSLYSLLFSPLFLITLLTTPFSGAVCGPGGAGRHQEQAGGPREEDHRGRRELAGEGGGAGEAAGGQRQGAGRDHQKGADPQVHTVFSCISALQDRGISNYSR